ncbi:MAG: AMP-binding protein [Pseudomonadota bacterium]
MKKAWLESYPPGVPETIDADSYPSVVHLLESVFSEFASRPAFSNLGKTLSYQELESLSGQFASWLQNGAGLQPGDRVALMMPNSLQYAVALVAALRAGLVVVNVNPLYTPRELKHQLNDSGAKCIVIIENFASVLEEVIADTPVETVVLTAMGDMLPFPKSAIVNFVLRSVKKAVPAFRLPGALQFKQCLKQGDSTPFTRVPVDGEALAFLQYTGGTTGVSKGAMLTHRNIVANLLQIRSWIAPLEDESQEIVITALPMYHVYSLVVNCLGFMQAGGHNILISNPRDMDAFVKEMSKWPFTTISGVNTLYNGLLHHPEFANLDFSTLKLASGGGMAMQRAVSEKWMEVTGTPILEGYGLTEASPVVCGNPTTVTAAFSGNVGLPYPSTIVSIRDEDGTEVEIGNPGELWVSGPQVMKGYWGREEATAEVITEDGWLRTGDIAEVDERGFIKLVDRKKDMIIVSGFNVFPNEIEDVVALCPGVLEAACIGVPDEKTGEAVKVFAVRKPGEELEADQIRAFCKEHLTGYKVPRHIEFRDELPKTNVGKILRRALREPQP